MSGPPWVRSMNTATEVEARSVLGPAGNKAPLKPVPKWVKKPEKPVQETGAKEKELQSPKSPAPKPQSSSLTSSIMRQQREGRVANFSMNASYSSDGASSSGSSSSGRARVGRRSSVAVRRKQCEGEVEKHECGLKVEKSRGELVDSDGFLEGKKRCAWVTPNTELCYAAFHDEEWGIPVHNDKKLFELLSLSGALAELTWPAILNKRHIFREIFLEFDPCAVSKLNVKKIAAPGTPATSLLSEPKIRGIIENARQMCKVIDEFGSFDKYIWNFVNQKPIASQFRYPRQVPVKTSKAEVISKDLVRRGFRSVGPTVVYSFMQVAGLTNDHLISCFRFQECNKGSEAGEKDESKPKAEKKKPEDTTDLG